MKNQIRWLHIIVLLGVWIFLPGCEPLYIPDATFPTTLPLNTPPPPKTNGSIYQENRGVVLYQDQVARRVGDVLTVRLEEATQGEAKGKTKTDKRAITNYPVPTLFGEQVPFLEVQTNTQQLFDSKGDSDLSNRLTGKISVTVMRVLPNNNLMVQGENWVTINQSREFIQLAGIVRPEDITPLNEVSSQRVGAAQIRYGARGQAGYATRGGIMTQLFNRFAPY